jgi:hypothetical protein
MCYERKAPRREPLGVTRTVNEGISLVFAVGILGALISGWKARRDYRIWLCVPVITFVIIWILTPTVFWPMIREVYGAASGRIVRSDADLILLVRRWIIWDWLPVALIAAGFVSSVRAIGIPFHAVTAERTRSPAL